MNSVYETPKSNVLLGDMEPENNSGLEQDTSPEGVKGESWLGKINAGKA